jgi:GH15 family glucan-1,4-alpha-glucosidase
MEAWVYPVKLLRDFKLRFHLKDRILPARDYARELIVHPGGTSIVYATAGFTVRETLVVPPDEAGALVRLDIDTFEPLQIEAQFVRDFQLMWPAGLGGTYIEWDKKLNVFAIGHEQKIYAGVVGSPQTAAHTLEFFSNSGSSNLNSLSLQPILSGQATQFIFIAGSAKGPQDAAREYAHLSEDAEILQKSAQKYYSDYLNKTVSLKLPDAQLQAAYDWSRISIIQGLVENPSLGRGLIAGYRTAGDGSRPGFGWFFGRDSLWTDFALDSIGDFGTVRTALEFIAKFQRADGKIEHEIPQTAGLVPWFTDFKYAYAAADSTPLYILAVSDYVTATGDLGFLNHHWDNLWRAYLFLHSTYDSQGVPKNLDVGHGWIEGGPLLPVEAELYQSGLGTASLHALANLAALAGKPEVQKQVENEFAAEKQVINDLFWSADKNTLVFALNQKNRQVELPTVLSSAPMWFDVFDPAKVNATIDRLAGADQATDWGMRVLSDQSPLFDPGGYHFGSVWPLLTGWASVGEYRWHRPLPAYANLQANSQLALEGSPGHVTEVLSGTYYEPLPESSPHQIWSSAMVVLPLIRGLLGIYTSKTEQTLTVAPHLPAGWDWWSAGNVPACDGSADLVYARTSKEVTLQAEWHARDTGDAVPRSKANGSCTLVFSPAASLHATVGKNTKVQETLTDKHATVSMQLMHGSNFIRISVANDFGISVPSSLPSLAGRSRNLKIVKEQWSSDRKDLRLEIQGVPGNVYRLKTYRARISTVDGGRVFNSEAGAQEIEVTFPPSTLVSGFADQVLVIHLFGK